MDREVEIAKAEATKVVAKAVSDVTAAATNFGKFIAKYTHEPLEAGVGIFSDKLKYYRWERQLRLMKRAEDYFAQENIGTPVGGIPLKLAIPLFEAASLEDDDLIQDLYAKLLINSSAVSPSDRVTLLRGYIDTLERFTPAMMIIFNNVYKMLTDEIRNPSGHIDVNNTLPEDVVDMLLLDDGSSKESQAAWNELDRLECMRVTRQMNSGKVSLQAKPTYYGILLYNACTLPSEKQQG